ncbi:ATP-binding protein [Lunatibacter salilacus]|uniref:ATP-binding protein n=1 Tax=Lunatibacter salilacus TaxID=2483804 RepID=UPI00131B7F76|nr:ATP-binding protein [Lunatibacter salilacus]
MNYLTQEKWMELNKGYLMGAVSEVKSELLAYIEKINRESGFEELEQPVASNKKETIDSVGEVLPTPAALEDLADSFQLSSFERKILVMCAGTELDTELVDIIANFRKDGSHLPTLSLAMAAFKDAHWSAIFPEAPLRYWNLINITRIGLLTLSPCTINEYVLHYLIGINHLDHELAVHLKLVLPEGNLPSSHGAVALALASQVAGFENLGEYPLVQVQGDNTGDRAMVVAEAFAPLGFSTYKLQLGNLPTGLKDLTEFTRLWNRSSLLNRLALFIDMDGADQSSSRPLQYLIENALGIVVLGSENGMPNFDRSLLTFNLEKPLRNEQENLWRDHLGNFSATLDGSLSEVIGQFNLNTQSIKKLATATVASLNAEMHGTIEADEIKRKLWKVCCKHTRPDLDNLAQRIDPLATWDDLVLPETHKATLKEIAGHVKHRQKVYDEWGFAGKSTRGLGITAMFSGESGTGKTMASEVLANELKLDLYRIDLSQIVNKYIGETEKNLKKVFEAAEGSGAILLFDEADALFGKRSEVKDSHDRYSNIEVSYLLQKMEEYRGLAILTTNMKGSLDKAFLRRIRFVVHFPFPDAQMRAEIWKRIFPKQTPTNSLNFQKLANLNVAGGNIRNIALNAAFSAAGIGGAVTMQDIQIAARGEYQKLEKQLSAAESLL